MGTSRSDRANVVGGELDPSTRQTRLVLVRDLQQEGIQREVVTASDRPRAPLRH
jgi:hypothetical protein